MKHLINREDYIREFLHIDRNIDNMIETEINNENELYEGLLSTVFGGLKMLFKKDWVNIKCKNPSVLEHLKAIDKSLVGYTLTKMQYSSECQNIRQNVANYFNDILDYKLLQLEKEDNAEKFIEKENTEKEENTETNGVAKVLNLKDKTLLDTLKKYKDNIASQCKVDPKLREYADQLLNSVVVFINDIILAELEKKGVDAAKLEEEKKKIEEEKKKLEEERKKRDEEAKKANEEAIKKISEDRDEAIKKLGVNLIGPMAGDKAIDEISNQFNSILTKELNINLNEAFVLPTGLDNVLKSDTYIGVLKSLKEVDWKITGGKEETVHEIEQNFYIRVILSKIATVFKVVSKQQTKKKFVDIPSTSVQAMMISLANAVIYGFVGDKFDIENEARLSLMTKCAIDSDATIGFGLPLMDDKKPELGNYFTSIMHAFKSQDIKSDEVDKVAKSMDTDKIKKIMSNSSENEYSSIEDFAKEFGTDMMKDFRPRMSNLFELIVKKAKEIKDKAQKEREAAAAKAEQESNESN